MRKILTLLTIFLLACCSTQAAEKIPVKIIPAENISTTHDEIQVGDNLLFTVKNDVYYNRKILFAKGTKVVGYVSFFDENGWANDNAEIQLSQFKLRNTSGDLITIKSTVTLNGFELLKTKGKRLLQFFNYIGVGFRGKEVDIKYGVDKPEFTIWYVKN